MLLYIDRYDLDHAIKRTGSRFKNNWYITMKNIFNFSEPPTPHLQNDSNNETYLRGSQN